MSNNNFNTMGGSARRPKLTIPARISNSNIDTTAAVKKWKTIETAIDQIYQQNASQLSFQNLYTASYQVVLNRHGAVLYDGVQETFTNYVKSFQDLLLLKPDETFLNDLLYHWDKHRTAVSMIRDILMYLDKNYIPQHKKTGIYEMGTQLFASELLFCHPQILHRFQTLALEAIRKERDGENTAGDSRSMLKSLTSMMLDLSKKEVYDPCFEQPFLHETEIYYRKEAAGFFHTTTVSVYLTKVQSRLKEERERAERCFDPDTKVKVENVLKTEMIDQYKVALTDKDTGVIHMMESWKLEDLRLVFEVLGLVPGALNPAIEKIRRYCTENGVRIVNDPDKNKKPLDLIEEILSMRERYEELLIKSFSRNNNGIITKDKEFDTSIRRAFEDICNSNNRFPEYLSLYADSKLTRGKTQILEQEYDCMFDRLINLFRHVKEKDVFEKYYKTHLAKRLLTSRSASDDAERGFITKLKAEFGYQFTAKLEGMFTDMKLTKDYNDAFKEYVRKCEGKAEHEMHVSVLTTGCWPVNPASSCTLPDALIRNMDIFREFYAERHSGRRLAWQFNMGTADLRMNGFGKIYEVDVSTYQMAVLLLFNNNNKLSFHDIQVATNIPSNDLKMNMFALCSDSRTHQKLLINSSADKKITDESEFYLNHDFSSSKLKFKIAPVVVRESQPEFNETMDKINEDRKWQIDAVVVRVMKSRKTMEHRNLVVEVTKQLQQRFTPSPDLIKKRIESLIERDYLERCESSRSRYNYLA